VFCDDVQKRSISLADAPDEIAIVVIVVVPVTVRQSQIDPVVIRRVPDRSSITPVLLNNFPDFSKKNVFMLEITLQRRASHILLYIFYLGHLA
jgi:hypothetical protein